MSSSNGDGELDTTPYNRPDHDVDDNHTIHDAYDGRPESPRQYVEPSSTGSRTPKGNGTSKPSLSSISPVKKSASEMDVTRRFPALNQKPPSLGVGQSSSGSPSLADEAETQLGHWKNEPNVDVLHDSEGSAISHEPDEPLEDFDWDGLTMRYHETVKELSDEEADIVKEYTELSQMFAVWAQSGPKNEVESSYKRLKTHMKYVRKEEQDLEVRRMHYVKVIDAFQSALRLLGP